MITAKAELRHTIDRSEQVPEDQTLLRRLVRCMTEQEAEALLVFIKMSNSKEEA